jgi:hypothetical protein
MKKERRTPFRLFRGGITRKNKKYCLGNFSKYSLSTSYQAEGDPFLSGIAANWNDCPDNVTFNF